MKNIYISAVNVKGGGPSTVVKKIVLNALKYVGHDDQILIITNSIFNEVVLQEFRDVRIKPCIYDWVLRSLLHRLFFEYIYLPFSLRKKEIDIWISLNDVSSFISAKKRFVYFHNPSPFIEFRYFFCFPLLFLIFGFFYNFIYLINSKNYDGVIVQQSWIARLVKKRYNLKNVKVARPVDSIFDVDFKMPIDECRSANETVKFVYPAFPRAFKNHKVIIDAIKIVRARLPGKFEVVFTLSGSENSYSKNIYLEGANIPELKFVGMLSAEEMNDIYRKSQVLIFPSYLETWGLPISEAKDNGLVVFLANLPYAREVAGDYLNKFFFEPNSSKELSNLMISFMESTLTIPEDVDRNLDVVDFNTFSELVSFMIGESNA